MANNREVVEVKVVFSNGVEESFGVFGDNTVGALTEALEIAKAPKVERGIIAKDPETGGEIKFDSEGISVKINIDAEDAIKTLKAIQREARETTKVMREFETDIRQQKYMRCVTR